jgi:hypothetical protein
MYVKDYSLGILLRSFKGFTILLYLQIGYCSETPNKALTCLTLPTLSRSLSLEDQYVLSRTSKLLNDCYGYPLAFRKAVEEGSLPINDSKAIEKSILFQLIKEETKTLKSHLKQSNNYENIIKPVKNLISYRAFCHSKHHIQSYRFQEACPTLCQRNREKNAWLAHKRQTIMVEEERQSRNIVPMCFNIQTESERVEAYRTQDQQYYIREWVQAFLKNSPHHFVNKESQYCYQLEVVEQIAYTAVIPSLVALTTPLFLANSENREIFFDLAEFLVSKNIKKGMESFYGSNETGPYSYKREVKELLKKLANILPPLLKKEDIDCAISYKSDNNEIKSLTINSSEYFPSLTLNKHSIADLYKLSVFFPETFEKFQNRINGEKFIGPFLIDLSVQGSLEDIFFFYYFSCLSKSEKEKIRKIVANEKKRSSFLKKLWWK